MTKIEFLLEDEKRDQIRVLEAACGFTGPKDLLNNALTIFEWMVREISEGRIIGSIDEKNSKYKELSMEFMMNIPRTDT